MPYFLDWAELLLICGNLRCCLPALGGSNRAQRAPYTALCPFNLLLQMPSKCAEPGEVP